MLRSVQAVSHLSSMHAAASQAALLVIVQWALRVLDNEELGARREVASAGTSDRLLDLRPSSGI